MRLSNSQRSLLERASQAYEANIHLAKEYLEKRGLSLEDARGARLGVVVDPVQGHEHCRGRLSIPYVTQTGIVDIRFRTLGHDEPKYLGLSGARTGLYNVNDLFTEGDYIAVTEGEIDALTLHFNVGIPAVGIPGANSWKPHYRRLLQDFDTIYVFCDGDQPGRDFAKAIAKEVRGVVPLEMPEGEDVNSMFLSSGKDYFLNRMAA